MVKSSLVPNSWFYSPGLANPNPRRRRRWKTLVSNNQKIRRPNQFASTFFPYFSIFCLLSQSNGEATLNFKIFIKLSFLFFISCKYIQFMQKVPNFFQMNIIPGSATSPAARYYRQIEHPSSQISTQSNNTWTSPEEQQKAITSHLFFFFS